MSNKLNNVQTLESLVFLCQFLAEKNIPSYGWTEPAGDETPVPTGHWTATAQNMAARLKRRLTEAEVTLLSLSRGWGPLPWFSGEWRHPTVALIWTSPNHSGDWLEWEEMGEILQYLLELEQFEESWVLDPIPDFPRT
jgi:hypothetical protein